LQEFSKCYVAVFQRYKPHKRLVHHRCTRLKGISSYRFYRGLSRSMTYHACTSRWLSWRSGSEREREKVDFIRENTNLAILREKDMRENTETPKYARVTSPRLATEISRYQKRPTYSLSWRREQLMAVPLAQPTRTLGHRGLSLLALSLITVWFNKRSLARYWPIIESRDETHFRKCIFWVTGIEARTPPWSRQPLYHCKRACLCEKGMIPLSTSKLSSFVRLRTSRRPFKINKPNFFALISENNIVIAKAIIISIISLK